MTKPRIENVVYSGSVKDLAHRLKLLEEAVAKRRSESYIQQLCSAEVPTFVTHVPTAYFTCNMLSAVGLCNEPYVGFCERYVPKRHLFWDEKYFPSLAEAIQAEVLRNDTVSKYIGYLRKVFHKELLKLERQQ